MRCAACIQEKELQPSKKLRGIRQPRFCAECIEYENNTGDALGVDLADWLSQLIQAEEYEGLAKLKKEWKDGPF